MQQQTVKKQTAMSLRGVRLILPLVMFALLALACYRRAAADKYRRQQPVVQVRQGQSP